MGEEEEEREEGWSGARWRVVEGLRGSGCCCRPQLARKTDIHAGGACKCCFGNLLPTGAACGARTAQGARNRPPHQKQNTGLLGLMAGKCRELPVGGADGREGDLVLLASVVQDPFSCLSCRLGRAGSPRAASTPAIEQPTGRCEISRLPCSNQAASGRGAAPPSAMCGGSLPSDRWMSTCWPIERRSMAGSAPQLLRGVESRKCLVQPPSQTSQPVVSLSKVSLRMFLFC